MMAHGRRPFPSCSDPSVLALALGHTQKGELLLALISSHDRESIYTLRRMSEDLFVDILGRALTTARIDFKMPDDSVVCVGNDSAPAPDVVVAVHRPFFRRVLAAGNLGLGEAFMDGDFEIAQGTLPQFLEILLRHRLDRQVKARPMTALRVGMLRLGDALHGKAHNVQRHYDVGDDLFEAFLDRTLTYSCGYAESPDDDLDTLQQNKLDRICRKLRLQEGERLLDIGCGFGGLLIFAAQNYGVRATGITLSRRHCALGTRRIEEAGFVDRVEIHYADFGEYAGEREHAAFDKVVSVGMLEHVPRREYGRYFSVLANVLRAGGVGLVHAVGANTARKEHDPFTQKYIFPASNQVLLSEIALALERRGLAILDVENMIRHYALTAARWLERFLAHRSELDEEKYDLRFQRMWEYYLACATAAGDASDAALYQVLFTNDYAAPIPLRRV